MSFTRAADELNVTQAAVSYNIKQLEAALGVPLFIREHRAVRLTQAGDRFYNDVSMGLSHIRRSAEAIAHKDDESQVTLSCSTAFASYWMVPKLAAFRAENPGIEIRLQTTDKDVDLVAEGLSLGIRRGSGDWPGREAALLAAEEIMPVSSPAYARAHGPLSSPADLLQHDLIYLDEPFRQRPSWDAWFDHFGVVPETPLHGLHLNDYGLVLQAAMAGEGVALGWKHLTDTLVDQGWLQRLWPEAYSEGLDFYVVWDAVAPMSPAAQTVRDWLVR